MGCNCKKQANVMSKYSEDKIDKKRLNFGMRLINFIVQICFNILAACVVSVIIVPLVIYIIICVLLNKEPKVKIINFKKHVKK